jgi:hypothetical protein
MEMYLEELPRSFYGKSFTEVALYVYFSRGIFFSSYFVFFVRICFKLRVMILAVEMTHIDENGNTRMIVEVAPKDDCIILCGTRAFMVCSSSEDAKRFN